MKEGERTGVSTIIVDEKTGENRILYSPGANWSLRVEDFWVPDGGLATGGGGRRTEMVVLQLEVRVETVVGVLERCRGEEAVEVCLNAAPVVELPRGAYRGLAHLVVNEREGWALSGWEGGKIVEAGGKGDGKREEEEEEKVLEEEELEAVARTFLEWGVKVVVITLGARGAFYRDCKGRKGLVPAVKVKKVVDTTAAGDTFVGAYAGEVVRRRREEPGEECVDVRGAVEWAVRCAAKTVEKEGAQGAIPWAREVEGEA